MNYTEKVSRMENQLRIWGTRNLILIGKILVVKSMGLSNLIHIMYNTSVTKQNLIETKKIVNTFVCNSRQPKIKHEVLRLPYEEVGLRSPDVVSMYKAQKLTWIRRIFQGGTWMCVL